MYTAKKPDGQTVKTILLYGELIATKTYSTAEAAKMVGVHPNTARLYERLELIPKVCRKSNGYRVFTERHIDHFKLVQTAFHIEILQNGLRKKITQMVKTAATGDYKTALSLTYEYIGLLQNERQNAQDAVRAVKQILSGKTVSKGLRLKRKEAAEFLQISLDTLRNWEMNGLLTVKRMENGYRVYTGEDIDRLKIIRSLRCANYSLEAILRMLSELSTDPDVDIALALHAPKPDDDTVLSVYDRLLASLKSAESNAETIRSMLLCMRKKY